MSIFQNTQRLEDCETVLAALKGTEHDNDEYLLHDRTREQHAQTVGKRYNRKSRKPGDFNTGRNDHGGPFVAAFLDQGDGYNCLTSLPYLVKKVEKALPQDLANTRYTKFRVGEIKDYLIADILWAMKDYDIRKEAAAEAHLPGEWRAKAAEVYGTLAETRKLRITYKKGVFTVTLLDPIRGNIRGFGTYLENIQAGEVSLSPEAFQALATIGEQHCGGLPALSFWGKPKLIIGGMFGFSTQIPATCVSIPGLAFDALKGLAVVE